ncbi:MAG: alpha/beta hydrolase [Bacteroidota bacterium]
MLDQLAVKRIGSDPNLPTIVFLHDSLGCIELWRDFPEKLGTLTNCNVIIYDRQGYGKSCAFSYQKRGNDYMELEADILIELLDKWNLEKATLFGHSDGGSIALIAAGKYPDRVSGVITEGAHIFVEDITINGIQEATDLYKTTNLKAKLEKYHGDKTEDMFWAWAATWNTEEFKSWNIEHFLPTINCPCLIIQGEDDEYGSLEQVERIISGSSDFGVKLILPGVKHTPHKEKPEEILNAAKRFIDNVTLD